MEGVELTDIDTNRRPMSLYCAGYMANLHATALHAEIGEWEHAQRGANDVMLGHQAEEKRVKRIRVPAVPRSTDRYPGGASQRVKALRMGHHTSGSVTHRGGLESGRVDALRLDSAPPGSPALAPLKSLHHARRNGGGGVQQKQQQQQSLIVPMAMMMQGGDERKRLQLRLPLGGVGGGDNAVAGEASTASDAAGMQAGRGGSVTERGTSGWRDPAWRGEAARSDAPARLSPLHERGDAHSPGNIVGGARAARGNHAMNSFIGDPKRERKPKGLTWKQ